MVKVIYRQPNGEEQAFDLSERHSVMEGALRNGVPGIDAECGGCASCATCHVYVDDAWIDRLDPPEEFETDMLEMVADARPSSRLSCQISLSAELDGLIVHVPASQTSVSL